MRLSNGVMVCLSCSRRLRYEWVQVLHDADDEPVGIMHPGCHPSARRN